ncbi:MAG: ADP-forming succinate--CoA ligase subunit beta, partial [Gammaproteobacteria bacterium]|nr:ADP-forming succinate--CoA ligase subunit beta [Gammaproteobacteria bacterium]
KAQLHAGARGKAGGIKIVSNKEELIQTCQVLLGSTLATPQTHGKALPVNSLLIEPIQAIQKELYLGMLLDRNTESVTFMASTEGGMDIEEVAAQTPEKIIKIVISNSAGLQSFQCRQVAFSLGLKGEQFCELCHIMHQLYDLYIDKDLSLIEINPLIIDSNNHLCALDAKINVEDNALYRHSDLLDMRDTRQEDPIEVEASQHNLNYITLDGNIGCMVNGAGLAMATMDIIKLYGGEPANFLDVGGGTTAERVAEAFKLIVQEKQVRAILVNIFGGIVRCDLIAEGIIIAVKEVGIDLPVIVRLEGTKAPEGLKLLSESNLSIQTASDLNEAAQLAVHSAS